MALPEELEEEYKEAYESYAKNEEGEDKGTVTIIMFPLFTSVPTEDITMTRQSNHFFLCLFTLRFVFFIAVKFSSMPLLLLDTY